MKKLLIALAAMTFTAMATASLPPPSDEARVKAAEAKDKAAWSAKVAAYKLCLVQDRVAADYLKSKSKPKPATDFPACQNPGAYVASQAVGSADSKPIPEVGAKK